MAWRAVNGVVEFPDGARIRGGAVRGAAGDGPPAEWRLLLLGRRPRGPQRPGRWLWWPDFWLPTDAEAARSAFAEAHRLALAGVRVEVACTGGRGRTGTALGCIAQLAGVPPGDAVEWVRAHYRDDAIETPWQRRYVRRFAATANPAQATPI